MSAGRHAIFEYLRLAFSHILPTPDADHRGMLSIERGGAGVADTITFARKTAADAIEWADVAVSSDLHAAVTVSDTASVDLTLTGQQISAAVLPAGVTHNNLAGLTTGDPHTQYVLAAGDTMTGALVVPSINTPLVRIDAQSAADVTSTTSTVTFQDAITLDIPLPSGTWDLYVLAGANFSHSASGLFDRRVEVDGSAGSTFSATGATTREHYPTRHGFAGVAGGVTVTVRLTYKSNAAGTTGCRAPWISVYAERVS